MTPNNNLSCLPFYRSLDEQNARKWWVHNRIYPLFTPANMLLPFQIMRKHKVLSALDERIPAEYIYRQSDPRLGNGPIQITKILGNTLVWNQYVNYEWNNANVIGVEFYGITTDYSNSTNLYYVHGTASGGTYDRSICRYKVPNGHKVLLYAPSLPFGDAGDVRLYLNNNRGASPIYNGIIVTQNDDRDTIEIYMRVNNGATINTYFNMIIVDLTLLFNGNVPSGYTAADFGRDFPNYSTTFNKGQLINNSAEGLETVGFNQWDEEWLKGTYSRFDGKTFNANDGFICSKNYISVLSGQSYIVHNGLSISPRVLFYDANENFITSVEPSNNEVFVIPSRVSKIKFQSEYVAGAYQNNICVNISDPNRNGQYEPYKHSVLDLHLEDFQVKDAQGNIITITGGLKQAGSVRDEIVGNKYIRRVGTLNLGNLRFNPQGSNRFSLSMTGMIKAGTANVVTLTCGKYIGSIPGTTTDKSTYITPTGYLNIIDSACNNDAATLQTACAGVKLNYELVTPIEFELLSPIIYPLYYGYLNGTEEVKYAGTTPVAPIRYEATPYRLLNMFKIFKADGTELADYTEQMNRMLAVKTIDDIDMLVYAANIPFTPIFPNGQYYAVMSDGLTTWYSEMFTAVNDIQPYLKIEWWDVEDFVMDAGIIVYTEPKFKNILYLDSDLAKPEYPFEEEGETRDGYFFPIKQISEKHYRFKFFASEYLLDVMRFIRMADYAQITYHGQTYKLDTFLITPEWEDNGDVASVEAEFDTATVAKKIGRGYLIPSGGDFNDDFNNDFNVD